MKPWELVHRGTVHAMAVLHRVDLVGEAEARRRVLATWTHGDRLFRVPGGLVHRFHQARVVPSVGALIARADVLVAAPLRDLEWAARPVGAVVLVEGAALRGTDLEPEDPAAWIDVPEEVVRLASIAPPPVRPGSSLPGVSLSRGVFGVGEMSADGEALLGALRSGAPPPEPSGWAGALPSGLGAFFERTLGKTAERVGLGGWLRERHGTQLDELLERFEGDLDAALRHAIPLGGKGGIESHPALRRRKVRKSLSPSLGKGGGGGTVIGSTDRLDALKAAYRRSAEALVAAGEIEKAAFVLSDLLGEVDQAVDLLELHERYGLAAQLCEGHSRSMPRAIRLYLLAGQTRRAFSLATRFDAYAEVLKLFSGDVASTRAVRSAWAARLVSTGRLEAAVEAVWPDEELHGACKDWLSTLVSLGGQPGARALVRLETLDTDGATQGFGALLRSTVPEDVACRAALARTMALAEGPRAWGRALSRQQLIDGPRSALHDDVDWPELADLKADSPPVPIRMQRQVDLPLLRRVRSAGSLAVEDALWTPHGTLVALGEAGLAFYGTDGQRRWGDGTPATRLVGDPEAFQVLALHPVTPRRWRISRVDLRTGAVSAWVRAELNAFADRPHHGRWVVAEGGRMMQIDLAAPDWQWLWRGPALPGGVVTLEQREEQCFAVLESGPVEGWSYDRVMVLRSRTEMEPEVTGPVAVNGNLWAQAMGSTVTVHRGEQERRLSFDFDVSGLRIAGGWLLAAGVDGHSAWVQKVDANGGEIGRVQLEGASRVGIRLVTEQLFGCWDDIGRVVWVDGPTLVREVRV